MAIVYAESWDVDLGSPDNSSQASRVTSPVYDGAGALRINPAATQGYWLKNASGTPSIVVIRVWVRFATLPSVDLPYFIVPHMGVGGAPAIGYDQSSAQFYCTLNGDSTHAPGGPTITTGVWYRIDAKFDCSTTTSAIDAQVDGTALTQHTDPNSIGACADYRIGDYATGDTYDAYFDHLDVSHTAGDYPLGPLFTLDTVLPDADITTTGWSTAPLFSKINDASDATVITATAS